jgi:uncharacterized membrane protein
VVKHIPHLATKLRVAHLTTNLSYAALLIVLTAWAFTLTQGASVVLWAIVSLPLLILWPGMRKKRHRSYSWLCFVILLYFIKGVEGTMSPAVAWTDVSILALSVVIFIGAMLTSRWLQYAPYQLVGNNSDGAATSPTDKDTP